MAGTANSITSHNSLRGVLNANNIIAGGVGTAFDSTYSVIAETGAQIALSISSTDYKMQATLKDKYGNIIYTSNIIDLPLETMVVNARYDKNTKEVVLILDNGNELRFSVADLVEGLVSTDQLNSVLTDYVKFTDYATSAKGGTIKSGVSSFAVNNQGQPYALEVAYNNYGSVENTSFISKGTLENIITGKELVNKTYVDEADAVFEDKLFGDNNVKGNGTELTIDNTAEAPMKIVLKGNTYQDSTTGKNLFDISKVLNNGTRIVNNGDGTLSVQVYGGSGGSPSYLKTYCPNLQVGDNAILTLETTSTNKFIYLSGTNQSWRSGVERTITQSDLDSSVLWYSNDDSTLATISNIMVRLASITDDTYEPYTNGASPNPDYPQPIQVVSGDNSIEVCGKNLLKVNRILGQPSNTTGGNTVKRLFNYNEYIVGISANNYYFPVYMSSCSVSNNSITVNTSANAYGLGVPVKTEANKTYKLSYTISASANQSVRVGFYSSDGTWLSQISSIGTNNYVDITTPNNCDFMVIVFTPPQNTETTYSNIMLEKGNQATTYKEYKSASYPISLEDKELCKIGTYQDKIGKSSGKNLLDLNRTLGQPSDTTASNTTKRLFNYNEVVKGISGNNYYYPQFISSYSIENQTISITTGTTATYSLGFPIKIKANTTYTMSFDKNSTNGRVQVSYYTSDGTHLNYESKIASFTFTTPSNCDFILINFTGIEANTTYTFTNCMLNEGSTALPYEPYGTRWYLKKEIGKVVLDGSESWASHNSTSGTNYRYCLLTTNFLNVFSNILVGNENNLIGKILCDNFNQALFSNTSYSKFSINTISGDQWILFNVDGSNISTLADWKTWLSTYNTTLYYILATPTYETITDEILIDQLEAIKLSYENQTNISQTNNDLPFELNISAVSGNLSGIRLLLEAKEDKSNKVAVINEYSTDEQYPTAKCVYKLVGNVESILETLDIGDGVYTGGEFA